MSQNEFRKVDDFTSQYTGKWSPFDNQWFGLDFSYRGIKYRFQTWSKITGISRFSLMEERLCSA